MGRMSEKRALREMERSWVERVSALDGRGFWLLWAASLALLAIA